MSYCPNCASEVLESQLICSKCGFNLKESNTTGKVILDWVINNILKSRTGLIITILAFNSVIAAYTSIHVGLRSENGMWDMFSALQALIGVTSLGFIGLLLKK